MRAQNVRRLVGLVIILPSLVILLWGLWPTSQMTRMVRVHLPEYSAQQSVAPSAEASHNLVLTWPARLRVGDRGLIQLSIEEASQLEVTTGSETSLQTTNHGDGENRTSAETGNMLAEGRLELSGMLTVPSGEIYEPMGQDGRAVFFWNARPDRAGIFDGFVWLHLNAIIPGEAHGGGTGTGNRSLLSAQRIQMTADDLFGMDGATARLLGAVGIAIAFLLLLDTLFLKVLGRIVEEKNTSHA